jgi:hypothetical protein
MRKTSSNILQCLTVTAIDAAAAVTIRFQPGLGKAKHRTAPRPAPKCNRRRNGAD